MNRPLFTRFLPSTIPRLASPNLHPPLLPLRRSFTAYYPRTMSLPDPASLVKESLARSKHDKWGWVIYRTTYSNDPAWTKFKHMITQQSAHYLRDSDSPEIFDSLEWTFMDDGATFNGASPEFLRTHFRNWAERAAVSENPRASEF